jgi:hypothetical protein
MIVLGLVLPMESVLEFVFPLTWVWPVLIWSAMGTNETYYRTHQLIFTAMAVGGLFVPTLAVALGIWSGNGKLFQLVFMIMWYLGPLNKWDVMDFMGSSQQALDRGVYPYYLLATIILLMLAVIK